MSTQNLALFQRFGAHTKNRIFLSINADRGKVFSSYEEFIQYPLLSHMLEESTAFSTALSYVYTEAQKQIEQYMNPRSARGDFTKARFMESYLRHIICFAARPNCPDNWSIDQYLRMIRAMEQFFNKLFNTDLEV